MNAKLMSFILVLAFVISAGFKGISNLLEEYRHQVISDQVCKVSEIRLQVGATREVIDVAKAALIASGHPDAELALKVGNQVFIEPELDIKKAKSFSCVTQGREDIQMDVFFPRLKFFDSEFAVTLFFSLAALLGLKIIFSIFLSQLQQKFIVETDKRLSEILGILNNEKTKSPIWIEWLFKSNPKSIVEFKNQLNRLEKKVSQQSKKIKNQAEEKVRNEIQLTQAKKFKDLAHQVRHDLRQTLGVIKSAVSTLTAGQSEKNILSSAISSLEHMVEDLKEREYKNIEFDNNPQEIVEVALYEVVSEQKVFLGNNSRIKLHLNLVTNDLNLVAIKSSALKRVFTNLVRNSIEAIADLGSIDIFVKKTSLDKVLIAIEDSGAGFSQSALENLFTKGFTTKKSGSGLGLSYCSEQIRSWGGSICVIPNSKRTRIEIELPVIVETAAFVHPNLLSGFSNCVVVDDLPIEQELNAILLNSPIVLRTLAEFEQFQGQGKLNPSQTIIFDLHLEFGRKALEAMHKLPLGTDYLFMTSDYLNSELLAAAQKHQFMVIPKDLVNHALESTRLLNGAIAATEVFENCIESSDQI